MSDANQVRLGHALGCKETSLDEAAVLLAVKIAGGDAALEPRLPIDAAAVLGAESALGAAPRPLYAFVGSVHPDLGSVGFVISRAWSTRSLQGITRCDSGGLYGGRGAFACLSAGEAERSLVALSTPATCSMGEWDDHFSVEIDACYADGVASYVAGEQPNVARLADDARARCLRLAHATGIVPDRRVWTWEARMNQGPHPEDLVSLILSYEALKRLEGLVAAGAARLPASIQILYSEAASHWFDQEPVRAALRGDA